MNTYGFVPDILARLTGISPWIVLLAKTTLLLSAAWAVHYCLARANPRWRVLLWRGTALGLVVLGAWSIGLPGWDVHIQASAPVAASDVADSPVSDEPGIAEPEPIRRVRAFHEVREVPATAAANAAAKLPPPANREEAAHPVAPPSPPKPPLLSWPVVLLGVWCGGVALLLVRLAVGYAGLARLLRGSNVVSEEIDAEVKRIAAALGCRRTVDVRSSRQTAVPFTYGLRRAVLVLPERMCQAAYREELPGVAAHEFAHVVSGDFAWNMAIRVVSILLWFHPLAWRMGSAHRAACDAVCDATAASYLGDVAVYCRTLADVALASARTLPGLGLAMARTCDVRRRIAALQRRVFAAKLSRRAIVAAAGVGLIASALLAGTRFVRAEAPVQAVETESAKPPAKDSGVGNVNNAASADTKVVAASASQPVSMSAEAFGRLSAAEQRVLLVRVYRRRLEQSQNLFYEVEETQRGYNNDHGKPGKPSKDIPSYRWIYRHWRLGESFRGEQEWFDKITDAEPASCSSDVFNAVEGVARNTHIDKTGKSPSQGQVQYPISDGGGAMYRYWFEQKGEEHSEIIDDYVFSSLIRHQDQFEIKAPIADGKVQLTVPWQLSFMMKLGGKRVFVLDPQKAFLPIRSESRWDDATFGKPEWRMERFEVQESRLVGGVWLPTKLKHEEANSYLRDSIAVWDVKVLRIEPGAVKLSNMFLPFTAGMEVADTIEGATYIADAKGNPVNPKIDPNWMSKPPVGWVKRASSMLSNYSPADRAKLDAERNSLVKKNGRERMAYEAALKVMRSSAPLDTRIEAGLNALRTCPLDIDNDFKPWASVIRELIELDKPAVPKLTAELDRTERDKMLRDLAFVLRGIGDPRAAPALIRAIPRLAKARGGDYGFEITDDPKLMLFMLEHDNEHVGKKGPARIGEYLSYGAPIREIMPALKKLVGGIGGRQELRFAGSDGGREQRRLQDLVFLQLAERWAAWWSKNWPKYVKNEEEAQLEQTAKVLGQLARSLAAPPQPPQTAFPTGPHVVDDGGSMNNMIRSFDESPADGFLDLDTGRLPNPPARLVKESTGHQPSPALLAWADKESVNLVCMKLKGSDGTWFYAWKPLGMKVWRIENSRYGGIAKELQGGKLQLPPPWEGPIAQWDEKTGQLDNDLTATYLFITKRGTCGVLKIKGPLGDNPYSDCGLSYKFIYEKEAEPSTSGHAE